MMCYCEYPLGLLFEKKHIPANLVRRNCICRRKINAPWIFSDLKLERSNFSAVQEVGMTIKKLPTILVHQEAANMPAISLDCNQRTYQPFDSQGWLVIFSDIPTIPYDWYV